MGSGETAETVLVEPRRSRIVEELRGERDGLDVQTLAERLDLHPNTIRWHLGVLADAGLVQSGAAERGAPGRPRMLYKLGPEARRPGREEYRLLATVLAGAVEADRSGGKRAEEAGCAWGRYLVGRPLPMARTTEREAVAEVARVLDGQGFDPETEGRELRMRRCPFHDLAEQHPTVVCAVHRGLISGALEELGSDLTVAELRVFVEPDLCVARLAPRS